MKILKTAKGKKLSVSKREWEDIGRESGWIKISQYRGPGKGTSEKEVTLYREEDGTVSIFDDGGEPFTATIHYSYNPSEEPEYDGGYMTYPGSDAYVEIDSIIDEKGEEVPVDDESILNTFDLESDYESSSEQAYEQWKKY